MRFQRSATVVTREVTGETVAVPAAAPPLSLLIGNVPLSLYIPCDGPANGVTDDGLREAAAARYAEFRAESSRGLRIYFRPRPAAKMGPIAFAYDLGHASLVLRSRGAEFLGVRNEYDIDSLVRVLLSMALLRQD